MEISDTYKTIKSKSSGLYREKGSKFVSVAFPVSDEQEVKNILSEIKKEHHEARHHCYAYIIGMNGDLWRANDDGEPSGTGGKPILGQIRSFGLLNVLIVVSRYFGGTLLGVSGLINAYRSAAESALKNAVIQDHIVQITIELIFPYASLNDVMKIIKEENITQNEHYFGLECRIVISLRLTAEERIMKRLARIENIVTRFISTG